MTGVSKARARAGSAAADWVSEVCICVAVKSGFTLQKVIATELAGTDIRS
jgi:hypothetical protein